MSEDEEKNQCHDVSKKFVVNGKRNNSENTHSLFTYFGRAIGTYPSRGDNQSG